MRHIKMMKHFDTSGHSCSDTSRQAHSILPIPEADYVRDIEC